MANPKFQIIITDDTGVNTYLINKSPDMLDAMRKVFETLKTKHLSSVSAVTATTL